MATSKQGRQVQQLQGAIDMAMAAGISRYGGEFNGRKRVKDPTGRNTSRAKDRSLIARHFTPGYGAGNYRPLTQRYAQAKRRMGKRVRGLVSDLVLSGELRHSVLGKGVIRKINNALWTLTFRRVPDHGVHQIKDGRDWAEPSPRDRATVEREVRRWMQRYIIGQNRSARRKR